MKLPIDLVSDFVCPWCFIGKTRLDAALARLQSIRPDVEPQVNWLPFFLNPDTPPEGEPYRAFLEAKFGGPQRVDEMLGRIAEAAVPDGVQFAFDRIRTRPNTLDAHRLCYRAQSAGWAPERVRALAGALFAAHFQQGRELGDTATLADIAAACGERHEEVLDYLDGTEHTAEVQHLARHMSAQGIQGVPFFIFNHKLAVSGAQPSTVLVQAMLQSLEAGEPS